MEESYLGCYSSLADYAKSIDEETAQIPEDDEGFYEWMGSSMVSAGEIFTIETGQEKFHVFLKN